MPPGWVLTTNGTVAPNADAYNVIGWTEARDPVIVFEGRARTYSSIYGEDPYSIQTEAEYLGLVGEPYGDNR